MSFKNICFSLLFTLTCLQVQADDSFAIKDPAALIDQEISRLEWLIQATEQSLAGQKKLHTQIKEYQKYHEQYLDKPEDNDLLVKLIKNAYRTLEAIKENHLTYTFDSDFIDELTVLSQPAKKRGIPKP